MWTTENICKGTQDIEFEQDWSVGLGATLADGQKIKKTIFLVSGIFSGKADSVILLCFECTTNPQNLIKIVKAIFKKTEFLYSFFMWTTPKIKGSSHEKKKLIFSKMAPTILIKFCGFVVHSKHNNMTLSAFPGKISESGKIYFKFFSVS